MVQLVMTNHQWMVAILWIPELPTNALLGTTYRKPRQVFVNGTRLFLVGGVTTGHGASKVMNIYQILNTIFEFFMKLQ